MFTKAVWALGASVLFCCGGINPAAAQNLITNGGFETGDFTGWGVDNIFGGEWTVQPSPSGGYEAVGMHGIGGSAIIQQFNSSSGSRYNLSFDYGGGTVSDPARFGFYAGASPLGIFNGSALTSTSAEMQHYSMDFTAGGLRTLVFNGLEGLAHLDNVSITPLSALGDGLMHGTVNLNPSGQDMLASFVADPGLTLEAAAQKGGFDHFNWFQVAVAYPGPYPLVPRVPFIDPPNGGLGPQKADNLPFYWDETSGPGQDASYLLSSNQTTNILSFIDTPADVFVVPGVNYMKFYTSLVGVAANGQAKALYSWTWQSDTSTCLGARNAPPELLPQILQNCVNAGGVTVVRNVHPLGDTDGGVFGATVLAQPYDLPDDVLAVYRANGIGSVPEPAAWTMLIFGFGAIGNMMRRSTKRARMAFA